jgi:hypothetical protein
MMSPWLFFTPTVFAVGAANLILSARRAFRGVGFRGARDLALLPVTPIAEARTGRMKFCGKAHGVGHVQSIVNAVACIAHRRVTWSEERSNKEVELLYELVTGVNWFKDGRNNVVMETTWRSFPFELDDGSGQKLAVDPASAVLDYETVAVPEAGSTAEEQYLRDGDTLVVVGEVEVEPADGYREQARGRIRFVKPPLISWRSEPETLPKVLPRVVPSALTLLGALGMVWAFLEPHGDLDVPFLLGVTAFSLFFGAVYGFGLR